MLSLNFYSGTNVCAIYRNCWRFFFWHRKSSKTFTFIWLCAWNGWQRELTIMLSHISWIRPAKFTDSVEYILHEHRGMYIVTELKVRLFTRIKLMFVFFFRIISMSHKIVGIIYKQRRAYKHFSKLDLSHCFISVYYYGYRFDGQRTIGCDTWRTLYIVTTRRSIKGMSSGICK